MDLRLLRNNARAFRMSAERSLEQRPLPNGQIEFLPVPAVVALAFSIELYFKFFLMVSSIKRHKLLELFNLLDPALQQDIINSMGYNKEEFELLLIKHTNAFVDWRYLHETGQDICAIITFIGKLSDCLERIAFTISLPQDSENGKISGE